MNSSMIGKIEKAHRYAREPERVQFDSLSVSFHGSHDNYSIALADGRWRCSCHTFSSHVLGTCSHVMALQQMLAAMLPGDLRFESEEQNLPDTQLVATT